MLIAGPCGAETYEQVMQTAEGIAKNDQIKIFRAGIWKPRTRPNSFEGVGETGLKWLQEVKKTYGLLTTVEVANKEHTELALKYGVDVLWIGARTTVNPFSVQEIADVLKGVDIPVMIKNPVHPDLQLWIGAIERIQQAGIDKMIAIHRGFHDGHTGIYRNHPLWEIPIELKTIFPNLPVICDPSHIGGKRMFLKEIAQKALDLGMQGLMIESHIQPDKALSDAQQQLTPDALHQLLSELTFRKTTTTDAKFNDKLQHLRNIIDELDEEMIQLTRKRIDIIEQIAEYKQDNNVSVFQLERWMEILKSRTQSGIDKKMNKDFIEKLCLLLHEESIRVQTELMSKKEEKNK
ncbi:MAG: synthetase [Bacteroidetes bacterium]|nr:synthetase [Bacteroidota bacterium]